MSAGVEESIDLVGPAVVVEATVYADGGDEMTHIQADARSRGGPFIPVGSEGDLAAVSVESAEVLGVVVVDKSTLAAIVGIAT